MLSLDKLDQPRVVAGAEGILDLIDLPGLAASACPLPLAISDFSELISPAERGAAQTSPSSRQVKRRVFGVNHPRQVRQRRLLAEGLMRAQRGVLDVPSFQDLLRLRQ